MKISPNLNKKSKKSLFLILGLNQSFQYLTIISFQFQVTPIFYTAEMRMFCGDPAIRNNQFLRK